MFLFSWLGRSNLCRMSHQAFDPQFFHQVHKPLHGSGGFDPHTHGPWKVGIKLPHDIVFMLESRLLYLSRCGIQHRHCLLATVQITSYNSPLGLLRSEHCRVNTEQFTRAVARPTSLRHQSGLSHPPNVPESRFGIVSVLPSVRFAQKVQWGCLANF